MNKRVIVGMSGGVDSSVAALLLKEQGYEVIGVTMQTRPDDGNVTRGQSDDGGGQKETKDAEKIAKILGIPYDVVDFTREFRSHVIDDFIDEYLSGKTPNPCVVCNRTVKWEALFCKAGALHADYVATGHYAKIERLPSGRFAVRNSVTAKKDQTYVLYRLTQDQLAHTLFPIGDYHKEEIRQMAKKANLPVFDKPDSQEICFIPDGDYASFIERECRKCNRSVPPVGNFVDKNGKILGQHRGITHYTIGQRRGLDIAAGHRIYVTQIRTESNEVVLGEVNDLYSDVIRCDRLNFMSVADVTEPRTVLAKIRYHDKGGYCRIEKTGEDELCCFFEKPVRAATPGQAIVFYDGEYILGGGTVKTATMA